MRDVDTSIGATDEQADPATLECQLLDRLDDQSGSGRPLRMTVNQGRAVVVERLDLEVEQGGLVAFRWE